MVERPRLGLMSTPQCRLLMFLNTGATFPFHSLVHTSTKMQIGSFVLLGYYAAQVGGRLPTFPDRLSVPSSMAFFKMGPIGCPETSVTNHQPTPRNIPEERRLQLHCGVSLKYATIQVFKFTINCSVHCNYNHPHLPLMHTIYTKSYITHRHEVSYMFRR